MNLEKHIDNAVEHYKTAYGKLDTWERERQVAIANFKQEALRLTQEAAVQENAKLVQEYNDKRSAIEDELKQGIAEVETEYMQEVMSFYTPNGVAINVEDQALLSADILTVDEIAEMVLKHADNPTMERIIRKYVTERGIKDEMPMEAAVAMVRATSGGENERRIFDTLCKLLDAPVNMAANGQAGTEVFMRTALKADEYAKDIKFELFKTKLVLNDDEKEQLKKMERERLNTLNANYDPQNKDYGWY